MYGNKPPAARRLAQPPQKYADGGMVARMKSADAGPATFGSRGLSQLRDMIPKMQAMGYPQQTAAAPAAADPRAAQLQAMIPQVEAMGYKQQPQRLADGGFVSAAKRMMGLTPEDPARAAALAEYKANAAREKAAAKAAAAPAPAPQAAVTQYTGMSAMQRREKEQGLADGGVIRGPGTGTSDSIPDEMEPGTFIMPADSTKALGLDDEQGEGKKVPVRVSNGEYELPPERVQAIGAAVLEALRDSTHEAAEGEEEGEEEGPSMAAQKLASGGMVENDVTRVGNSYSGGNVGGDITVNGAATSGTFSQTSAGRMAAMPAAAPAPVPATAPVPSAAAQPATAPAPAAAPAAPMGWAERNAQRSNQVTASSIVDSPERRAAQAALAPSPVMPQSDAQRIGAMPAAAQPVQSLQPRRYADGGTVTDDQESDYARQMRAMGGALVDGASWVGKTLVSAPGYGLNKTPAPAPAPDAASRLAAAPTPGAGRGMVSPPAVNPSAPRPVAPPPAPTSAADALSSGVPSAQASDAATSLSRRGAADALALMPNAPAPIAAPTVRNSTNDWAARNNLRNLEVSASSITNNGGKFDRSGKGDSAAMAAYKAALGTDQALQQAQPGADVAAMRENAGLQRAGMQETGANTREAGRLKLAGDELGMKRVTQGFQNRAAARMENLGNVLLDPNATPEQRKVAQRSLSALSGKTAADRMQVVNLPDSESANNQVLKGGQALVRTLEDGTVEQVPIGGRPAVSKGPQVGVVEKGWRFKGGDPAKPDSWERA